MTNALYLELLSACAFVEEYCGEAKAEADAEAEGEPNLNRLKEYVEAARSWATEARFLAQEIALSSSNKEDIADATKHANDAEQLVQKTARNYNAYLD